MGTENVEGKNELIKLAVMGKIEVHKTVLLLSSIEIGGGGTGKSNLTLRIINGGFTVLENYTNNAKQRIWHLTLFKICSGLLWPHSWRTMDERQFLGGWWTCGFGDYWYSRTGDRYGYCMKYCLPISYQDTFIGIRDQYYRNCDGFVFVYSIADK